MGKFWQTRFPHKKVDFWRNSAGISVGISFFGNLRLDIYLAYDWISESWNRHRYLVFGIQEEITKELVFRNSKFWYPWGYPRAFFAYIVQLSLTSLLSGHVARCHFPDFCREIIWNHNLDIRTMRSFVISPCIPNTRYLPRFQLFCGVAASEHSVNSNK